jgi:hypothetical protein
MRFVGYERQLAPIEASEAMILWLARGAWIVLPVTSGDAIDDAIDGWATAPRVLAACLLFAAWTIGTIGLFTPRPRSFTILRVAAPTLALTTYAATIAQRDAFSLVAALHATVAAIVALSASVADTCVDGVSYGNERRHPLRLPPQFRAIFVPVTVVAVIGAASAGPLLLADRRWLVGAVATIAGIPLLFAGLRSLAALERRFVVLVPAGIVVSDSLTLCDPVLFPRDHVVRLGDSADASRGTPDAMPGVLDLRLGARPAIELITDEPAPIPCRAGRTETKTVTADRVLCSPLRPGFVIEEWNRRGQHGARRDS